jgi:hypothetical protein
MTTRKLHEDWPAYDVGAASYDLPVPINDVAYALEAARHFTASVAPELVDPSTIGQGAEVARYKVRYHDADWTPDDKGGGSELDLTIVARLTDGRWLSIEGWNDYTGWGCQDGSEVRVGTSEDDVVWNGLTAEGRTKLGYPAVRP